MMANERPQLRLHRRLRAPVARWHGEPHHLGNRPGIDPKPPSRRPLAQTLDLNGVANLRVELTRFIPRPLPTPAPGFQLPEFYSGATDRIGRFTEGLLLRRLQ